jgi:hypothetical protein
MSSYSRCCLCQHCSLQVVPIIIEDIHHVHHMSTVLPCLYMCYDCVKQTSTIHHSASTMIHMQSIKTTKYTISISMNNSIRCHVCKEWSTQVVPIKISSLRDVHRFSDIPFQEDNLQICFQCVKKVTTVVSDVKVKAPTIVVGESKDRVLRTRIDEKDIDQFVDKVLDENLQLRKLPIDAPAVLLYCSICRIHSTQLYTVLVREKCTMCFDFKAIENYGCAECSFASWRVNFLRISHKNRLLPAEFNIASVVGELVHSYLFQHDKHWPSIPRHSLTTNQQQKIKLRKCGSCCRNICSVHQYMRISQTTQPNYFCTTTCYHVVPDAETYSRLLLLRYN